MFFKQMLSGTVKSDAELWPSLGPTKESPLFTNSDSLPLPSNRHRTTSARSNNTAITSATDHSDDDSIDISGEFSEEACAPPEFKHSFGSAIAEALIKSAQSKNSRSAPQVPTTRGKKKKNNGKTVLFSTGGRTFDGK